MNIDVTADLSSVPVDALTDDQLREAFTANFDKAEELANRAQPFRDRLTRIEARLGRGRLAGFCTDCNAPLFEHDEPRFYEATSTITCGAGKACFDPTAAVQKSTAR